MLTCKIMQNSWPNDRITAKIGDIWQNWWSSPLNFSYYFFLWREWTTFLLEFLIKINPWIFWTFSIWGKYFGYTPPPLGDFCFKVYLICTRFSYLWLKDKCIFMLQFHPSLYPLKRATPWPLIISGVSY